MKYIVDISSNASFLQIFGVTETHGTGETPFAFQIRQNTSILKVLKSATEEVLEKIKQQDLEYHDSNQARNDFEYGITVFRQSVSPVNYVVQMRKAFLSIGGYAVGNQAINLDEFLLALNNADPT